MTNKTTTTSNFKNICSFLLFNHWEFAPGVIPTLAVMVLIPLLLSLGFWQLHRAVTKQQLLDQFALQTKQPPQPITFHESNYTPVQVSGVYDKAHAILLDNRIVNHQSGYDVLIPFKPSNGNSVLLVNLGWIPRVSCESNLSCKKIDALLPQGFAQISGLAQIPEHNFVLAHPKLEIKWPLLIEDIHIDELSGILQTPLYPFILLSPSHPGFFAHWNMVTSITPARHRGYAVQWFALALTLVILYIRLNLRKI